MTYKTLGDKRLDEPLSTIGAKGLFTKELEADLRKGKTRLSPCTRSRICRPIRRPGCIVAAVLEREDPRDALVLNRGILGQSLDDLPRGSRVGTSSLRRRAQLLAARPDLEVAELRGNVPTRLKKVDEGRVHAAILAAAGLHRLGAHQHITCYLDAPAWLPAAGQGAIAVQIARRRRAHRARSPTRSTTSRRCAPCAPSARSSRRSRAAARCRSARSPCRTERRRACCTA